MLKMCMMSVQVDTGSGRDVMDKYDKGVSGTWLAGGNR